jgi:predicted HTH transcriptional regulator
MRNGTRVLLGSLHNYLKDTLEHIAKNGRATARDLADAKKLEPNTSGTRLLNLAKKRLVKRVEEMRSDGKVWVYESL